MNPLQQIIIILIGIVTALIIIVPIVDVISERRTVKIENALDGHEIVKTLQGKYHISEKCERCRELQLARDQEMIQMIIEGLEQ